jgi:hypothetical protein
MNMVGKRNTYHNNPLMMETEIVPDTVDTISISKWFITPKDIIVYCHHESLKSCIYIYSFGVTELNFESFVQGLMK